MILDIIRLVCLGLTIYGCLDMSMPAATNEFIAGREGGRCRYLTNIGLYMCVITMITGLLKRFVCPKMFKRPHDFLASVALPINFTVFIIYWPILFHDVNHFRRMEVYLKGGIVSTFTDLCQHMVPEIGLIFEIVDVDVADCPYQRYFLMLYGILYCLFCIKVASIRGLWPYPFLERIGNSGRFVFYLFVVLISLAVYEVMVRFLSKKTTTTTERSRSKVKVQ